MGLEMVEFEERSQPYGDPIYCWYPFGKQSPFSAVVERILNDIHVRVDTSQPLNPGQVAALAKALTMAARNQRRSEEEQFERERLGRGFSEY